MTMGNDCQLWHNIMHYGPFDRMPVVHWAAWEETRARWREEGLAEDISQHEYFRAVPAFCWIQLDMGLYPPFASAVLEETAEYRVVRDGAGVLQKQWKHRSCIPQYIDFALKSAAQWDQYKARLQPHPYRLRELDARLAEARRWGLPAAISAGSLMGWVRNWMGVENMAYLTYDDPDVYGDMVNTIADLGCWAIDQVAPRLPVPLGLGHLWEDICGKSGPLVSPDIFRRHVAPGYRKIRAKLESYGCRLLCVDSDGWIEPLLPHWLDAGVNVHFPIEIGTWGTDPMAFRRRFGRELRMVGGIDKRVLERGRGAIDAEIERRRPLMADGGYIPMPDHLIPPGVPLADYVYYLERIRGLRF